MVQPGKTIVSMEKLTPQNGCMNSLDWTTGLDYWTGLLDSLKMWFSFVNTILRADT